MKHEVNTLFPLFPGDEFVEVDGILDLTVEARGHLDLNVDPEPEVDNFGAGIVIGGRIKSLHCRHSQICCN